MVLRAAAGSFTASLPRSRSESQYFCRRYFGYFTNQEWTNRSRVFAVLLLTWRRVICPAPFIGLGRRFRRVPAELIDWECQSHVCSDPERHGCMDGSAGITTDAIDHTRSSRWPMRGMPPASISLRVRGRTDVVSMRGSSPTATQPGSIRQGLTLDILAPAAIPRKILPIWREFLLHVPLDCGRCPFPA
jgi:hypothetical protein